MLTLTTMPDLTHFDSDGNARMVDVGEKSVSRRLAKARGKIRMKQQTAQLIKDRAIEKGDVLTVARIAGISGTKWTPHLIPMCHSITVDSVDMEFEWSPDENDMFAELKIAAIVCSTGKTGVEMEALSAVSISALTIYDMCKSVDREMEICTVHLVEKSGGKSGHFVRQDLQAED